MSALSGRVIVQTPSAQLNRSRRLSRHHRSNRARGRQLSERCLDNCADRHQGLTEPTNLATLPGNLTGLPDKLTGLPGKLAGLPRGFQVLPPGLETLSPGLAGELRQHCKQSAPDEVKAAIPSGAEMDCIAPASFAHAHTHPSGPMLRARELELTIPDTPAHPQQAYRAAPKEVAR